MTATGHIAANKLVYRLWGPPSGITTLQLKADTIYCGGISVFVSATSVGINMWAQLIEDQGLKVRDVLTFRYTEAYNEFDPTGTIDQANMLHPTTYMPSRRNNTRIATITLIICG